MSGKRLMPEFRISETVIHKCNEQPEVVEIAQLSHGSGWYFNIGYYHSQIFYCPYCGKHLDSTDKEKQKALEHMKIILEVYT